MQYRDARDQMNDYRQKIAELREDMRKVQASVEPVAVDDYRFSTVDGAVRLSELFGDKDDLFVIHNMGASCPYCTLWADGFNGLYDHLQDRAAFVLASPDQPEAQQKFAKGRGWRFPIVCCEASSFAADMGYQSAAEGWLPGVSVFRKEGDKILRVSDAHFGPGDDFCNIWHFIDLLPAGTDGWQPRYDYG